VLPVVGLVFTGLSSGTLALLSVSSRIAAATVLVLLSAAVLYLGWQTAPTSSGETGGSDAAPPDSLNMGRPPTPTGGSGRPGGSRGAPR